MIEAILIILGFAAIAFVVVAFLLYSIMQRIDMLEAEMHDDGVVFSGQRAYDAFRGRSREIAEARHIADVKDNDQ